MTDWNAENIAVVALIVSTCAFTMAVLCFVLLAKDDRRPRK
jgi:hypothetical protein